MKFYDIDNALLEAIEKGDSPVRLGISLDWSGTGFYESVFEQDIIEASFYGLKEVSGGTTARGEVLLDNTYGTYACGGNGGRGAGREVRISFSLGEGLPWFQRFVLYVDDNGFQDIRGPGRKRYVRLGLHDRSALLRKTENSRDWTHPAVFTYSVICDKTQPEKSLVHLITKRAGIESGDIDCATIPIILPYVKLTKNIWTELSELAKTFRAHLECAPEKPLVFAHSPYQQETENVDDCSYTFSGEHIFYLRETARAELYRNTVRLKINIPVALEKQEIWRYDDPPVLYDTDLTPMYPFRSTVLRDIQNTGYEAQYRIKDGGTERPVIYADQIDTQEEAMEWLDFEGGPFAYSAYDVTTHHEKAIITLNTETDGDLRRASIYGRPIVLDLNRSCFLRDTEAIAQYGTAALNVSGSYFSEDTVGGLPMYEDWTMRELSERLQERREFTVKTHRGLFHARIGAMVNIETKGETLRGTINALSLRYRQDTAFVAAFRIEEIV
ncbi:hypothetical protein TREPR_2187 [Treponema primitia ZAS-2]|uniref:Uncharacterized protein n=1 Tax=Treponema primitia (strain ATCC BAA-887 / DSM 12427 / ZAS-2) TaxID=545694 RepID=F5YJ17_TREPZ|nr:hypothetical protein [Treponema primitia]AEF86788.1 hypothetical protein TREPR_2187 [Treponema primitia ZAS-2]